MPTQFRLLLACACTVACGIALPARAQDRLFAEPRLGTQNPYQLLDQSQARLPVAAQGFSVVPLRNELRWSKGQEQYQLIFDGQLYWFADPRERAIFAAAPYDYAPVLGGDCLVTYVETGEREVGRLQHGLVHGGRIYFFAGQRARDKFQANPAAYANGDLANQGRCVVSQMDDHKSVVGLPATVATVNGLRYHFAGDYQRRLFASDPAHYGVQRVLAEAPGDSEGNAATAPAPSSTASGSQQQAPPSTGGQRLPGDELEEDEQHYAMEGYCPVSIQESGAWVRGSFQTFADFEGKRYLFAGEKEKKLFTADPEKYVPVLSGDCAVSKLDDGKQLPGSVYHSLFFEGRLYLFAGPNQVRDFKADPKKYVESASAAPSPESPLGSPPLTPQQEEPAADAVPEGEGAENPGNVLREGRRSQARGRANR